MKALLAATICLLCLMRTAHAQDKTTIVVNPFKMAPQVSWPYDMKELERQVLAELQNKDRTKFNISADASTTGSHCLTLEVEILEWHPGNAAKRALVGLGTGRESAKIRYWLTNQEGKKVFERDDTIRTEFYASAYSASVGQLAHPLADKIGGRLAEARLE
jgi:Domain of unknown function (DUF4410)